MPLNELQRCPALSELAKIHLDKLQHRKCPISGKFAFALPCKTESEEMLETGKEIASVFQTSGLYKYKDMEKHYCYPQVTASNPEHLQHVFVRRKFSFWLTLCIILSILYSSSLC